MRLLVSLSLLLPFSLFSQFEASTWYFGDQGEGLKFSEHECGPIVLLDGSMDGFEGVSTISDPLTGDLLFLTNSQAVYNRQHQQMPNGSLINGGNTITQVLIIPKPTDQNRYYVFTAEIQGFSGEGLRFHCVDLSLDGGYGDVLYKDSIAYPAPVTEKLTALRHANGIDIWVVAHVYGTNEFLSIRVTPQGVQLPPVISAIGKVHGDPSSADALGEMKADRQGGKIAVATAYHPHLEVFGFDQNTGEVHSQMLLQVPGGYDGVNGSGWYGLSFSPDGTKLYACSEFPMNMNVIQFDLNAGSTDDINNSVYTVATGIDRAFSMKLAPNGRIYFGRHGQYLCSIDHPDNYGSACGFDPTAVEFPQVTNGYAWGMNNLMESDLFSCATHTGLDETTKNDITLLGMSLDDSEVIIEMKNDGFYEWYDVAGRQIRHGRSKFGKIYLETPEGGRGVYILHIRTRLSSKAFRLVIP